MSSGPRVFVSEVNFLKNCCFPGQPWMSIHPKTKLNISRKKLQGCLKGCIMTLILLKIMKIPADTNLVC